jgi:hypothetical protein
LLSAPLAGGKATDTSIGVPSQTGTVVFAALPHQRCPALAPVCSVQGTVPPNTDVIAAPATDGTTSMQTTTPASPTKLRSFDIPSTPL